MKKIVSLILILCVVLASVSVFAASNEVVIDGEKVEIAEGFGEVAVAEDVVFIPIRFIFEHFGFQIEWAETEQLVMGADENGAMIVLQVNNNLFFANTIEDGGKIEMEKAVFLNNEQGRTYIPASVAAAYFGYSAQMDEETNTLMFVK
ncbi:MAG: hypothetical protein IJW15_03655 [Clostridia bacterium]|nr:hypothetical protein [Clostridia bacterium]